VTSEEHRGGQSKFLPSDVLRSGNYDLHKASVFSRISSADGASSTRTDATSPRNGCLMSEISLLTRTKAALVRIESYRYRSGRQISFPFSNHIELISWDVVKNLTQSAGPQHLDSLGKGCRAEAEASADIAV